ncbi:ABC transporter substrate-binding protein [Paeniglutamicibacter sp. MACA_103]|uniref:ABC transporter substrate-binding protein n=1 Tax=Paeniglutamicibacter sp. MACA_103 TaxID=3377337 RepID=UPI00389306E3
MWRSENISRRSILAIGAAAVSAVALTACSGSSGAPAPAAGGNSSIVWSTWGTPDELTRFNEFNKQFMERHPDIKVKLQPVASYGEYHSKLLAQLTSNTAPDVFYVGDDKLGQFVSSKRLMPLDEMIASPASKTKKEDFFPGTFGAAQQDGVTYAAPNDVNNDALWYDKKVLATAGITEDPATLAADGKWTTEKYLEMNDKIAAAGLTGSMFWNYWATHYGWISAQGGTAYDASGTFVGNSDPKTLAAVETLGKYFQDKKFIAADTLPDGAGADSKFVTHKAGFFAQGRYTIGTLKGAGVEADYDVVDWPTPDGKPAPTGIAASYLAVNADTKNKDAAFTFWTEFLSAEGQNFRLTGGGNAVPSIKGADEVVLEDNYPAHAQTFLDMRDIGFANYATEAAVPALSTDISDLFLELYQGKNDARGTLDKVAALIESKTGK